MKVLFTTPTVDLSLGGIARSTPELANAIAATGVPVALLYPETATPVEAIEAVSEVVRFPVNGEARGGQRGVRTALLDSLSRGQEPGYSLVHHAGVWTPFAHTVMQFTRKRELPLVVSPRGMLEAWSLNRKKYKKKIAWSLYQYRDLCGARAFHATAESEAESIRRLGLKQPIAVIPNGVNRVQRNPVRPEKRSIKTALFLSRINPKKGLEMLLDAWRNLAPADWRLLIVGNDDSNLRPVLEAKISAYALNHQVSILGPLYGAEKAAAYENADLFVLPSHSENFGIVVAEAMQFGLPVITTKGCPWEELNTTGSGWWVDPSVKGIQDALAEAFKLQAEELRQMGERGRTLIESRYLWETVAGQMIEFYSWMETGGKRPAFVL